MKFPIFIFIFLAITAKGSCDSKIEFDDNEILAPDPRDKDFTERDVVKKFGLISPKYEKEGQMRFKVIRSRNKAKRRGNLGGKRMKEEEDSSLRKAKRGYCWLRNIKIGVCVLFTFQLFSNVSNVSSIANEQYIGLC